MSASSPFPTPNPFALIQQNPALAAAALAGGAGSGGAAAPSAANSVFNTNTDPFAGFNNSGWSVSFGSGSASNQLTQPVNAGQPATAGSSGGMSMTTLLMLAGAAFALWKFA